MSVFKGRDPLARLRQSLPQSLKDTLFLRAFGFFKVPLLFYIKPSIVELTDARCVIRIPLNRRTKNHLNSMYFAVLAAGADVAGGLIAMRLIRDLGGKVSLVFKDLHADFLKRAEGDTFFACEDGKAIRELVERAASTGERQNLSVHVIATVPSRLGDEPVAKFTLTLSLKSPSSA